MESSAPALIYRDSDLIKRAIRDLYHRDISDVIVEGEDGYKAARGFMKLLMPSHVRRVQLHSEATPLFQRHGVEDQLSAMYQPVVQLKSGGYLVINPTEALVSIDINSGRSTREHNIEQTAFATNLEAANEIARQLRLRDMAGLIVIDFIDMEQNSHVRKVEKAMKEALKNDRARIQIGRISSFGLMEMSRQRLRTGVLEASTKPCAHCEGTGLMRTASSAGLSALRMIEDEAARGRGDRILLRAGREAAIYLLNKKRAELGEIESRYGVSIEVAIDESFEGARMSVESSGQRPVQRRPEPTPIQEDLEEVEALLGDDAEEEEEEQGEEEERTARHEDDQPGRRRRRRRRGGRGRSRREGGEGPADVTTAEADESGEEPAEDAAQVTAEQPSEDEAARTGDRKRRRRRGKRTEAPVEESAAESSVEPDSSPMVERPVEEEPPIAEVEAPAEPQPKRRRTRAKQADQAEEVVAIPEPAPAEAPPAETAENAKPAKPARKSRAKKAKDEPVAEAAPSAAEQAVPTADNDEADASGEEPRRGWWQRTFG
jgi:ribonuclease E